MPTDLISIAKVIEQMAAIIDDLAVKRRSGFNTIEVRLKIERQITRGGDNNLGLR